MYTAGTISGTKGSNKITGKSTQWLSNLYNILEGQVIVIYTPTSSNSYSIKSIKSNTEIELSKPLYDAFTNATYEIFTTLDNTTSDAAVKIATSIARNNDFMTAMNQWTTGTGTITVNWGNEQIKLTTVDQMNKNIDGKISKIATNIKDRTDLDIFFLTADTGFYTAGSNVINGINAAADYTWILHGTTTGITKYGVLMAQVVTSATSSSRVYIKHAYDGVWSGWSRLTDSAELDAKFNKTGGDIAGGTTVTGTLTAVGILQTRDKENLTYIQLDTTASPAAYPRINVKVQGKGWTNHELPDNSGKLMQVGDFGVGSSSDQNYGDGGVSAFISYNGAPLAIAHGFPTNGAGIQSVYNASRRAQVYLSQVGGKFYSRFSTVAGKDTTTKWNEHYTTANTTKDSNGNLKGASPIVKIYADDIDVNEESEGVELKKLHTGIYQLKGTLGMNSDPSWGGIHGGIVVPNGINGLQLVYADYDVLAVGQPHPFNGEIVPPDESGDIVVYTTYRKHSDLPQNIQRARLKTYPEFTKEVDGKIVELSAGDFVDIPNGHWLDVRVQMPSNSVYNIRQAEQEELARIAAEKAEAEEIERLEREAIEEAERIEREETERLEREEADRVAEEAERESYEFNGGDQSV